MNIAFVVYVSLLKNVLQKLNSRTKIWLGSLEVSLALGHYWDTHFDWPQEIREYFNTFDTSSSLGRWPRNADGNITGPVDFLVVPPPAEKKDEAAGHDGND